MYQILQINNQKKTCKDFYSLTGPKQFTDTIGDFIASFYLLENKLLGIKYSSVKEGFRGPTLDKIYFHTKETHY